MAEEVEVPEEWYLEHEGKWDIVKKGVGGWKIADLKAAANELGLEEGSDYKKSWDKTKMSAVIYKHLVEKGETPPTEAPEGYEKPEKKTPVKGKPKGESKKKKQESDSEDEEDESGEESEPATDESEPESDVEDEEKEDKDEGDEEETRKELEELDEGKEKGEEEEESEPEEEDAEKSEPEEEDAEKSEPEGEEGDD
jgi:hypothetical protein